MVRRRERALVLRRFPFGESSLVAHVLTEEGRRVHMVARGAFRPKSRIFGLVDLFDTLELEWSGRPGAMAELRGGNLTTRRRELTRDLERYHTALAGLELASVAAREEAAEPGLFGDLEALFDHLEDPALQPRLELLHFDLVLLGRLGLAPSLELCAACGGPAPPLTAAGHEGTVPFSAAAGGRLCRKCAGDARAGGTRVGTLRADVLAGAALLLARGPEQRAELSPPPDELFRALRDFVDRFLEYHLETRLRSRPVRP